MARRTLFTLAVFFTLFNLNSQELSRVAVVDGILERGISHNASPVVANYISETLVGSGKYTAVDRNQLYSSWEGAPLSNINIDNLLAQGDYKALGEYFQADLICVPRVTIEGSGYLLTVEMIEAGTGNIVARETSLAQGRIEELIDASRLAGTKITGGTLSSVPLIPLAAVTQVAPVDTTQPPKEQTTPKDEETQPKEQVQESKSEPYTSPNKDTGKGAFGSATISMTFPQFMGNKSYPYYIDSVLTATSIYDLDSSMTDTEATNLAFDFNLRFAGSSLIYFDLGVVAALQLLTYPEDDGSGTTVDTSTLNFSLFDFYVGSGLVLPLGGRFQITGGVTLGYAALSLGSENWTDSSDVPSGFTAGLACGMDLKVSQEWVLTLRYKYTYIPQLVGDTIFTEEAYDSGEDTSFGYSGIFLGIGSPF